MFKFLFILSNSNVVEVHHFSFIQAVQFLDDDLTMTIPECELPSIISATFSGYSRESKPEIHPVGNISYYKTF